MTPKLAAHVANATTPLWPVRPPTESDIHKSLNFALNKWFCCLISEYFAQVKHFCLPVCFAPPLQIWAILCRWNSHSKLVHSNCQVNWLICMPHHLVPYSTCFTKDRGRRGYLNLIFWRGVLSKVWNLNPYVRISLLQKMVDLTGFFENQDPFLRVFTSKITVFFFFPFFIIDCKMGSSL